MTAKSGDRLLKSEAVNVMVERLFPIALVITPNLDEAEALTGIRIESADGMRKAVRMLKESGRAMLS